MKTKSKIPALRFKGFTDAWEECKLGEVGNTFTGLSGKTKEDFGHGEGKFITYMNVFSNPVADLDGLESVEIDNKQFQVKAGDVLFTTSSETPEEVGMSSMWLGNADNIYLNSFCFGYRPTIEFDNYYLAFMFRSAPIRKKFQLLAQGISRYNISKNKVMEMSIPVPSIEEQEKIGSFFKHLDDTIALHQRKCDQTKELKKTMLQKMFPKKGERIPEIRFPEFTDEWEEKKLGEVVEREIKGKAKANMQGTKSIYLETEYLNGGETTFVDSDADIEEDDILILWDGSQAGTVYHGFFGALGSTLKAYRPKESGKFVYYQLVAHQEMIFQRYRTPNIPHVIKTFTDEFSVFTTSLSEQERIGNFFKHLDTLIALHQSKCDSLKELKKTLLRQLFV